MAQTGDREFCILLIIEPMETNLTPREKDIVTGLTAGWKYKDIAVFYGISLQTVKNILSRLYLKSNAKNKTELVMFYQTGRLIVTKEKDLVEIAAFDKKK